MKLARLLNTAWMLSCRGEARRFRRATHDVEATQLRLLFETLSANRGCDYGQRHQLDAIESYHDFCRRVPLATFDTFAPYVEQIAAGRPNVLTTEPVHLLEPTSGTSAAEKLIPYTRGLQRQFQRGVAAWIYDLYSNRPAVRSGRAYWSISPALTSRRTSKAGIPIGFDDDTAYLGFAQRKLAGHLLAVPSSVAKTEQVDQFQRQTLCHLLAADDLSLMSVWSPTFLTTLLERLINDRDEILRYLERPLCKSTGQAGMPPKRADKVRSILSSCDDLATICQQLWPRLALVSCWADAAAAPLLPQLTSLLPQAEIQPKGLLATEAFVSLPVIGQPGAALAVRSHFFEFDEVISDDQAGCDTDPHRPLLLAHQLVSGRRYRVVVTTMGGLYRYQLGDEVEVVGHLHECPLLRFMGRGRHTSDLVGEKLHESHVQAVIDRVLERHSISATFSMLGLNHVSTDTGNPPGYRLFVECDASQLALLSEAFLSADLEAGLQENPYYRQAVKIGQLTPARISVIDGPEPAAAIYQRECLRRGQRLGNIKPATIDSATIPGTDWERLFNAKCLAIVP